MPLGSWPEFADLETGGGANKNKNKIHNIHLLFIKNGT